MTHVLSFCPNLKSLNLWIDDSFKWPRQNYPTLEYVKCNSLHETNQNGVIAFFENNPQIKRIQLTRRPMPNLDAVLNTIERTKLQLDEFDCEINTITENDVIRLSDLQARGFFNRIKIRCIPSNDDIDNIKRIINLDALEIDSVSDPTQISKLMTAFAQMPNLIKLTFLYCTMDNCFETFSPSSLLHLDELTFIDCDIDTIAPFVRHLPKLKKLRIFRCAKIEVPNPKQLNEDRMKLPTPRRKLTIYLDRFDFLRARWAFIDFDYELVQIRRLIDCKRDL